jgi:hypothetical protein
MKVKQEIFRSITFQESVDYFNNDENLYKDDDDEEELKDESNKEKQRRSSGRLSGRILTALSLSGSPDSRQSAGGSDSSKSLSPDQRTLMSPSSKQLIIPNFRVEVTRAEDQPKYHLSSKLHPTFEVCFSTDEFVKSFFFFFQRLHYFILDHFTL